MKQYGKVAWGILSNITITELPNYQITQLSNYSISHLLNFRITQLFNYQNNYFLITGLPNYLLLKDTIT